jgi:hypothetical protein
MVRHCEINKHFLVEMKQSREIEQNSEIARLELLVFGNRQEK